MHICYGANWEPTISWLNQRLDDIKPLTKDKSYPPLGWWDKSRLLLHGRFLFAVDAMHWLYSTSLSPYNSTEFFTWQWNRVVVNWENGNMSVFHIHFSVITIIVIIINVLLFIWVPRGT
ncbi:unnamed protein product [Trichobilharzia regenti]|nr:unnamed protein product [Trichobilharzia regenti]